MRQCSRTSLLCRNVSPMNTYLIPACHLAHMSAADIYTLPATVAYLLPSTLNIGMTVRGIVNHTYVRRRQIVDHVPSDILVLGTCL